MLLAAFAAWPGQLFAQDDPASDPQTQQADQPRQDADADPFASAIKVPEGILDGGAEWLNTSQPLSLKDLKGKVVLVDFWTYCCINCMHVLPDLKYLEEKYANQLVVIGVHSAKFDNEKVSQNIRDAILRYEIKHPVVNDSEMLIWRRFGTRAWPTLAIIDPQGRYIGSRGGEGNRELFDSVIGQLVKYHRANGTLDETPIVFDLESRHAEATALRYPGKVLADQAGNRLFISDSNHNRIVVTDLQGRLQYTIGSGAIGNVDGDFQSAQFDHPQGMCLVAETLYVADTENHLLRSVNLQQQQVTTLAGTGSQGRPGVVDGGLLTTAINSPWDLCHIDGNLYIAMAGPHQIWVHQLGSDSIGVYAGNAREDVINGLLAESSFAQPSGLTVAGDGQSFYVADSEGSAIRQVPVAVDQPVTTLAGTSELPRGQSLFAFGDVDAVGAEARFQHPLGVAWHNDAVYVADAYNHKIRRVDTTTGEVSTWAGTGEAGSGSEPVQFNEPAGLTIAGDTLYIADTNNHRICTADLKSGTVTILTIDGLTPPQPLSNRSVPDLAEAEVLPGQTIKSAESVSIKVQLNIPDGYKLNELAPVVWEAFLVEGDNIFAATAFEGRDEAVAEESTATFSLPLTGDSGTATIAVQMSFGYCGEGDNSLCRLASATWKIPVSIAQDSENTSISLTFPEPR
jgi:thiol-disulfide isomerase/thioredoxin/sugar lactone lactonase YvrE